MEGNLEYHLAFLENEVLKRITAALNDSSIDDVIYKDLISFNIENKRNKRFLEYYLSTVNNEAFFLNSRNFFRQFKTQYSLQGIDNAYLDNLEIQKPQILRMIRDNQLSQLYFEKFFQTKLKFGGGFRQKDLGSFFTKLVHTFRPGEYVALDNPVRTYFGLKKESFFVAFCIVSAAYLQWSKDNKPILEMIKERFFPLASTHNLNVKPITDLKLLDMIFWSKGNQKKMRNEST